MAGRPASAGIREGIRPEGRYIMKTSILSASEFGLDVDGWWTISVKLEGVYGFTVAASVLRKMADEPWTVEVAWYDSPDWDARTVFKFREAFDTPAPFEAYLLGLAVARNQFYEHVENTCLTPRAKEIEYKAIEDALFWLEDTARGVEA